MPFQFIENIDEKILTSQNKIIRSNQMFFCERNPDFVWKVEDLLEVESKIKREEKYFFFTLKEKLEKEFE